MEPIEYSSIHKDLAIALGSLTYSIGYAAILEYSLDNWMVLFKVLNVSLFQSLRSPPHLLALPQEAPFTVFTTG